MNRDLKYIRKYSNCLLSSSSTLPGLESFPVYTPFVKFIFGFPQQVGILNVHLQNGIGEQWESKLGNWNAGNQE